MGKRHASFLMPDIPVSEGKLLTVRQHLGEVDGNAALIASMVKNDVRLGAELWLYTAEQRVEYDVPRVNFNARKVKKSELVATDGGLALVGEEFADHNKGWALVLVDGDRCSTQGIVTQCTLYEQYTSQEETALRPDYNPRQQGKAYLPFHTRYFRNNSTEPCRSPCFCILPSRR